VCSSDLELRAFVAERDWQQFHDPKNLALAIGSEAGELLAEYRWVRNADADAHSHKPEPRARVVAEAADVAIALLLFCDRIGLDITEAIREKLARNAVNYPAGLSRGRSERPPQGAGDACPDTSRTFAPGEEGMICGVDGCHDGWVAATQDLATGHISVTVFATLAELIQQVSPAIVAIDIPIGLPEIGSRRDLEARQRLGRRGVVVFPALLRPLLAVRSHAEASELRRRLEGPGVSIQAWSIAPKIREVDDLLKSNPDLRGNLREVHPEVCFYFMANRQAMAHPKKTASGRAERLKLLTEHFGSVVSSSFEQKPHGCGQDDLMDAFAALWTAQRIASGAAVSLPEDPDVDRLGLPMEIMA
jgi:predicted RNase H-like nuclease